MDSKCNLAVFASGTGSNFINIYNHIINGNIFGNLALLISNNPTCKAVEFAKENSIAYQIINKFRFSDNVEEKMLQVLDDNNIHLIILAGYMKKISRKIIEKYDEKIINIHPALLPKFGGKGFYGMNVHRAVIDSNQDKTGITIHFVNGEYDAGDIIYQQEIKVFKEDSPDTLAKRVLELEHENYPRIVKQFCEKYNKELN
tara:strand:+ start:109 stop:711 length:603 start_codon:yes stop_codon:yes gene_type:complete